MPYDKNSSHHLYWIRSKTRKKLRKILFENGIETGTHYRPIHTFNLYKTTSNLPITELAGKEIVTLPIHPNLTEKQLKKIITLINNNET